MDESQVSVWNSVWDVKKLSDKALRDLKLCVNEEIRVRELEKDGGGKATSKLHNILWHDSMWGGNNFGYTEEEKYKTLSGMTESEFSKWSGVGRATILAAKRELEKRGLKFRELSENTAP